MKNTFKTMALYAALAATAAACSEKEKDDNTVNPNEGEKTVAVTSVSLNQTTATLNVGDTLRLTHTVAPENATNKAVAWTSSNTVVATVANGKVTAVAVGTATIIVTTADGNKTATCVITIPEGVVINGVKWATRNVDEPGTFAATPESAGKFYQWNRNVAWSTTEPGEKIAIEGWTPNPNGGASDASWEKSNDPSPTGWRVPTIDEIKSLLDVTKVEQFWDKDKKVRVFTDKQSGYQLYMPLAGGRFHSEGGALWYTVDTNYGVGYYWSSNTTCMRCPNFGERISMWYDNAARTELSDMSDVLLVRPVAE